MKKFFPVLIFLVFLLIFMVKSLEGKVFLFFDFRGVSEIYVKFVYELGNEFELLMKQRHLKGDYQVKILEVIGTIIYQNRREEEQVIVALINEEETPLIWVRVRELTSQRKIKRVAKEFSEKIFGKLIELEKKQLKEKRKKIMV